MSRRFPERRSLGIRRGLSALLLPTCMLLHLMSVSDDPAEAGAIALTTPDRTDARDRLIEGIVAHLGDLDGEPRRIRLVAETLDELLPPTAEIKADVEGDLLPRLRLMLAPNDPSDPPETRMLRLHWSSVGFTGGFDREMLPALLRGPGRFEDDPATTPRDAQLIHFCQALAVAAATPTLDAAERACVEEVLDRTLSAMVRAIREVLDEADLPRDERTFRLDRLAEAMDVVSDVVAPYLGTSLVPRLQTCRNSLDPWRRAVEEGIADWKRNFWDRRLEDLRVSCQDDRGRWMGDCLVAARRSQEPLSGLLGSPNQVQVVGRVARLLDAALEAQVPREASEALERGRELVRLAAELERARRLEIDRDAADAIESVDASMGFQSLDEALLLGGIKLRDGLVTVPPRLGPPKD